MRSIVVACTVLSSSLLAASAASADPPRRPARSHVAAPAAKDAPAAKQKTRKPSPASAAKKKARKPSAPPVEVEEEPTPPQPPPSTTPSSDDAAPPASAPKATGERDAAVTDTEPGEDKRGSAAAMIGYASGGGGLGLGARGGYRVYDRVVVGGALVYQLGNTIETGEVKTSASYFFVGPEGGYDLPLGPVVVRPYLGLGLAVASVTQEARGQSASDSSSSLALWPGATVTYQAKGVPVFVGLDTRMLVVTRGGDPSFTAAITAGARF